MTASWPTASATSGSQVDQTPSTTTNQEVIRWPSAGPTGNTEYGAPLPPASAPTTAGSRSAVRKARVTRSRSSGGSARGPRTTARPVAVRTRQVRPVSAPMRSTSSSRLRPSATACSSWRWRSRVAASCAPRQAVTRPTTSSVSAEKDTCSGTDSSGRSWRRQASTTSGGTPWKTASPAARATAPAAAQAATKRSQSSGVRRQHQAGDDQLAAGQVAPGVGQVGGVDPAHGPVERPVRRRGAAAGRAPAHRAAPAASLEERTTRPCHRCGLSSRQPLGPRGGGWT